MGIDRGFLLRAWTERLYAEHRHALFMYRQKLSTPLIRIEPLGRDWGRWNPSTRTISIAERLIDTYPWDIVVEVLKHEMAHQLVDERFRGRIRVGGPHGEPFHLACELFGLPGWAASATGALPEIIPDWRSRTLTEEEERLLRRAEKLLALAESSNEHEAALAVERVRQLYAKYNIERIASGAPAGFVHCVIDNRSRRIPSEESAIFSILTAHFMVRAIFGQRYDARDLCDYRIVELLGARENVLMAEYVYRFLLKTLDTLWRDYRVRTRSRAGVRRSYMLGVLEGFRKKLEASQPIAEAEMTVDSKSLLRQADAQLEDFVGTRFPRLSSRWWSGGQRNAAYGDGVADGAAITLRKGVSEGPDGAGNRVLQLPEGR